MSQEDTLFALEMTMAALIQCVVRHMPDCAVDLEMRMDRAIATYESQKPEAASSLRMYKIAIAAGRHD